MRPCTNAVLWFTSAQFRLSEPQRPGIPGESPVSMKAPLSKCYCSAVCQGASMAGCSLGPRAAWSQGFPMGFTGPGRQAHPTAPARSRAAGGTRAAPALVTFLGTWTNWGQAMGLWVGLPRWWGLWPGLADLPCCGLAGAGADSLSPDMGSWVWVGDLLLDLLPTQG